MSTLFVNNISHTSGTNGITFNSDGSMKRGAFQAYSNSNQNITSNVDTKVQLDQKLLDPDNYFDTSTYRFTPQVAGIYFIDTQITWRSDQAGRNSYYLTRLYKNGQQHHSTGDAPYLTGAAGRPQVRGHISHTEGSGNETAVKANSLVHFNGSTDYVELYGYIYNYSSSSASTNQMAGHADTMFTYMSGFRVD